MVSARPTPERIATGHRDHSGEAFELFAGGMVTLTDAPTDGRESRNAPDRRPRDAGHLRAGGHGNVP